MKRRKIGETGLEITELSFGTSALGDMTETYGYGVDAARAQATLDAIFDGPVNLIDTSRNYGFGRSEQRIGTAIKARGGWPDGYVLSTKLDRDMDSGRFDAARVRESAEESLEALGLDRFQILHFHDPEHSRDLDEIRKPGGAIDELFKLKEEGLADAVGLAMGRVDIMFPLLRNWDWDTLVSHNRMTLLNRSADDMYDYAHEQGMAIINAAPFAGGVLAKGSDTVKKISYTDVGEEELAPVRAVEAVCAEYGIAPGAAALQFAMRDPRVATTLVGVSKPERVQQTIDWATAEIPEEAWKKLNALPASYEDPEANRVYRPG